MALSSWKCGDCTNICFRLINGEVFEYCRPMLEGRHRTEWVTEDHVECLDYTTDPGATDLVIKVHNDKLEVNHEA